jgi:hypothetical protein
MRTQRIIRLAAMQMWSARHRMNRHPLLWQTLFTRELIAFAVATSV